MVNGAAKFGTVTDRDKWRGLVEAVNGLNDQKKKSIKMY